MPDEEVVFMLPDPKDKPFISVAEALALTPISRGVFYEGLRRGEIPSRRVGKRFLIPTAEFLEWAGVGERAKRRPSN
jgi:excisionase family DNA binding protein